MKRILFIVVAYNGMRWLKRCLNSIPDWADVYVFDNNSTDGSADFVASYFPRVILVKGTNNFGFSKPNNLGLDFARRHGYDYAYLLNQDAWLEDGALERLVIAADTHPDYAVISPMQMTDGYKGYDKQFEKILLSVGLPYSALGLGIVEVPRVMAAHWLVPLRLINQIGLFEEHLFPHWGQDDEWCQRAHYFGFKVGVVPGARAIHDRCYRKESLDTQVRRNYYTSSLVRLCNPSRPILGLLLYVALFTIVKVCKFRSLLPFKYFFQLIKALPDVFDYRSSFRSNDI